MEHEQMIQNLKEEIELLARMHLLYGMVHTHLFEEKQKKIAHMVSSNRINVNEELDPVSRNLYRRYIY